MRQLPCPDPQQLVVGPHPVMFPITGMTALVVHKVTMLPLQQQLVLKVVVKQVKIQLQSL
jgi:hypothetical protein